MKLLQESSINDPAMLKNFIKYEVLQKKSVFDSYKTFCKTMGPEIMSYPEFEFWYMRFYNDQLDLDYARSQDPEPLTLSKLPIEIVDKVVKNLDLIDRINTRHVSKSLRQSIDRQIPHVDKLRVILSNRSWVISDITTNRELLTYEQTSYGCSISTTHGNKIEIKGNNFLKIAMDDMKSMMKNQKAQLEHFYFDVNGAESSGLRRSFFNVCEGLNMKLHFKSLKVHSEQPLVSILNVFNAGTLQKIELHALTYHADLYKILNTDHWKHAKTFSSYGEIVILEEHLNKFYHFVSFKVMMYSASEETLLALKNNIFTSASFEKCEIGFEILPSIENVRVAFGPNVEMYREARISIPGSNSHLNITFRGWQLVIERERS